MPDTTPFGHVLTAMVTPMTPDGAVDEGGVRAVARHLADTGHDGVVVNGTTGESATLTSDESIEVVRMVVDEVGDRLAVVAGVGSNSTAHSIEMAARAAEAGADSLLLVSPYYNKPTQPGLIAHCTAVADSTELPIMLYDIPGRTGVEISEETYVELESRRTVLAVKDATGDLARAARLRASSRLALYSGDDAVNLPWFALGAAGVVSVVAHVAGARIKAMIEAVDAGDLVRARQLDDELLPIVDAIMGQTQGAIATKVALTEMGIIPHAGVRLPLTPATDAQVQVIRTALKDAGLLA